MKPIRLATTPTITPGAFKRESKAKSAADGIEAREVACRSCDKFTKAPLERCVARCEICPGNSARLRPWYRMPKCPLSRW